MERAFRFSLILAFTLLFANCAKNSSSVAPVRRTVFPVDELYGHDPAHRSNDGPQGD